MSYNTNCNYLKFLDPFFDTLFTDTKESGFGALSMKTDISKEGDEYTLSVDVPGIKKEDIKLTYEDGYLTIEAKANTDIKEKGKFLSRERFSGTAKRRYYLGDVDESSITAACDNGVLTVRFNELKPEVKTKTIEIN